MSRIGVKIQKIILREEIDYSDLEGRTVAIDAPNIIMGLFNFMHKSLGFYNARLILDRTQRVISHLYGLLYRINFLYSKKIFPIFCFDGKVSNLKRIISKDQLKDFLFTQKWYQEALLKGDITLAREIALSKEYMWQNIIKESKELISSLGIPYIESPASAESQCAYLVKKGFAYYSNSQDFDSLLFGCPRVIQNLKKVLKRKVRGIWQYSNVKLQLIDLKKNLKHLKIDQFNLVDLGILIGCDYFEGVKGLGAKKAKELILKHGSLESVIDQEKDKYDFSRLTPKLIEKIRNIFLFPEIQTQSDHFYLNPPNKTLTFSLLCKNHSLDKKRVENGLDQLIKNYEKCKFPIKIQKKLML